MRTHLLTPLYSILTVSLLAAAPASASPVPVPVRPAPTRPAPPTLVQVDQRELLAELQALQREVQALQARTNNGRDGREMKRGLDSMASRLSRLERNLRTSRPIPVVAARPPVHAGPALMAPATFNALRRTMASTSFDHERQLVLKTALQTSVIDVNQARALLAEFHFASGKFEALRLMWPKVVDRENGFRFYEDFAFQSEKRTVETILRS